MTILDAVNRVKFIAHRGDQTVTTDQITTDILTAMNMAWEELCLLLPREAFRTDSTINGTDINVVQGTEIYSLTGNPYPINELIILHYTFSGNNYNVQKVESEREFWNKHYYQTAAQNRPYIYCHWGYDSSGNKQVRFFPVPDQNYTVHYSYEVDASTIDFRTYQSTNLSVVIPFLPPYMQFALWRGTYYYYLKSFDDPGQQQALVEYEKAKVRQDIADQQDMDSELQFRFDNQSNRFTDPNTGIRLQKL